MNLPGFGDEATWPPCMGHSNDPRTIDCHEEDPVYPDGLEEQSAWDARRSYQQLLAIIEQCNGFGTKEADALAAEARELIDFLGLGEE